MSERLVPLEIPDNLQPLFEAKSAHEAISATTSLLRISLIDDQVKLLRDPIFRNIVESALMGLDECRRDHAIEIIASFAKQHQALAHKFFISELN